MAQFDVSVSGFWTCSGESGAASVEAFTETVSVSADTESDIADADIEAALNAVAPEGCRANSFTVEGVFQPEPGQVVTVYAIATFDCGKKGRIYRTFRIDVPSTATRDEVLDEVLLTILAQMDVASDRYDCTYVGFDITAPLFYQYSSGG